MTVSKSKKKTTSVKRVKRGKQGKTAKEKKQIVDEIIAAEPTPAKRGRKKKEKVVEPVRSSEVEPDLTGVEPIETGRKTPVNYGQRTAFAKSLGITTQTLYNREDAFSNALPAYFKGLNLLPRRGGSLKELPDLTEYMQFCHRQFEELKRGLSPKDCTPNEILIRNNLRLFEVDLFDRQKQLNVSIISSEIEL